MDIADKVEHILTNRTESRDSDTVLYFKFMNYYYNCWFTQSQVQKVIDSWVSYASIIRERSRFQNTLKMYECSDEVKQLRKQQKSKYRDRYGPMYKKDL